MPAPAVIAGLFSLGSSLIDKLIPDPEAAAKAKQELRAMEQRGELVAHAVISRKIRCVGLQGCSPQQLARQQTHVLAGQPVWSHRFADRLPGEVVLQR